MPAFRDHNRVEDQLPDFEIIERSSHQRNNFGPDQHTGFDRLNRYIGKNRVKLFFDKGNRDGKDRLKAQGILGRQGSYDRSSISSQQGDDFQIGLDTRSTTRIRTGNG